MTSADFLSLFAYDTWANQETLAAVRPAAAAAPKTVRLLAHIAAAEHLWLDRIQGVPARMPVWPAFDVEGCGQALADSHTRSRAYLRSAGPGELAREVSYVNSKGDAFRNSVAHILTHVVFHSHYHRGQIAALVRAVGHQPAYTDFIHAVRTHALEPEEVP